MFDEIRIIYDVDGGVSSVFQKRAVDAVGARGNGCVMYLNGAEIEIPNEDVKTVATLIFNLSEDTFKRTMPPPSLSEQAV